MAGVLQAAGVVQKVEQVKAGAQAAGAQGLHSGSGGKHAQRPVAYRIVD